MAPGQCSFLAGGENEMNDEASFSSRADRGWDRLVPAIQFWGMVVFVAAVASRNLFPSEDAAEGSGVAFLPMAYLSGLFLLAERWARGAGGRLLVPMVLWGMLVGSWGLAAWHAEYRYPALNMFWEWLGVAILSLYAWNAAGKRGSTIFGSLLLVLCLMQSLLAGYESLVSIPRLRAMYERNDPAVAEAMREIGVEQGSKLEESFRHRLYSTEPLGTTGHPNTLAGLLVLGLPVVLLAVLCSGQTRYSRWAGMILAGVLLVAIVAALLMTKSRSAWIAVVPSVFLWRLLGGSTRGRIHRAWWFVGAILLVSVAGGLIAAGILDREIITQAGRSLSYRWEWWRGTLPIVEESPWVGVGPGNFRNHYLEHKLPFSSEEIADPHQFLLELAATGGLLALASYLLLLGWSFWKGVSSVERSSQCEGTDELLSVDESVRMGLHAEGWLGLLVAVIGVALLEIGIVPLVSRPEEHAELLAVLLAAGFVSLMGFAGVSWNERWIRPALVAGVLGLHVHLLTAGGVSFPSLMVACWGAVGFAGGSPRPSTRVSLAWGIAGAVGMTALVLVYVFQVFVPAAERDLLLERARRIEQRIGRVWSVSDSTVHPELWLRLVPEFQNWTEACRAAAAEVPADREGWERLAMAESTYLRLLAKLRSVEEVQAFRRSVKAWDEAIALDPRRSITWSRRGSLYREVAASGLEGREGSNSFREAALRDFERAAELYPNSAMRQWDVAGALAEVGRVADAVARYEESLRLDKTPHEDKRLTVPQRQWAAAYVQNHQEKNSSPTKGH
jgi:hypothetical protein